jgi:hypothetical protein
MARAQGWTLEQAGGPDAYQPYMSTWSVNDASSAVHYVEDDLLSNCYVVITGSRADHAAVIVERNLSTVRPADALARLERETTQQGRAQALSDLVIASCPDTVDARVLEALRRVLRDPLSGVRRTAIACCAYLTWHELDAVLEPIASHDPDGDVQQFASDTLAIIRRHRTSAAK